MPTVGESGGPADLHVIGRTTVAAPKGVNPAVADKIRRDIEKVLAEPDIAQRYATFGYELFPTTRDQFAAAITAESARQADVIKHARISLD